MSRSLENIINQQKAKITQLENVIENLPGSIYWKDKNGVYLGRNSYSAKKMVDVELEQDISKDSVIGKTDYDLFLKETADEYRRHDLEVMKSGAELTTEEPVTLPSGKTITQLSSKRPLRDAKGTVVGVIGNTVDITNIKEIEKELSLARKKAEEASKIKTEFIRNMEHDIRTPFSGVLVVAESLAKQEQDHEKKELLSAIALCSKELLSYCNDILDFSKIEAKALPVIEKKFSIQKVIQKVIDIETPAAKTKGLNLLAEYDALMPTEVRGDEYRLSRILLNLVSNSIKFTEVGHVKIVTKKIKNTEQNKVILEILVEDTGIGIPESKQRFIYEKFSRINPSNEGLYKGQGLGLCIVKKFVEEMNGEIEVNSSMGQGTTFSCIFAFKLPLAIVE